MEAFEGLGGVPALTRWAEAHPTEFYKLCARLAVTERHVSVSTEQPVGVVVLPALRRVA